ncbi:MAG: hypothetical protein P8Y67_00780 [Alphaproteobacteria bacterium]
MKKLLLSSVCAAVMMVTVVSPAQAISCRDGFQYQRNGEVIATPYCAAEYLAKLSRKHGHYVTGAVIRQFPKAKSDACRLASGDFGTADICVPQGGSGDVVTQTSHPM